MKGIFEFEDVLSEEEQALAGLFSRLTESAARREPLLPEEKELILSMAAAVKSSGLSAANLLAKMASAETQLRELLGVGDRPDYWPTIEDIIPLVAGPRLLCEWPGSDFIIAPTVLNWLGFLRQQNEPWVGAGNSVARPIPDGAENIYWNPDAPNELWRVRLLVGSNRATEVKLARRKDLDRLAEAIRFNKGRTGRRPMRAVAFLVEKHLYLHYCAFHGLLKRGQRESPKGLRDESSIKEFLELRGYPQFLLPRLAQELSEHRQRRRGPGIRLTLQDRAAMMVAELEGKRGEYGLPEPVETLELIAEDKSKPPTVATRKPQPGPFASREVETRYQRMLRRALGKARGRVRQAKAIWNSGFAPPESSKK